MKSYDHKKIEKKWQKRWEEEGFYRAADDSPKKKYYVLDMFPYPSGDGLHVGHVEGYTATDIYSRYKRMRGFNVLHPMGWDAFGLPAENYAIKTKIHPRETTAKAIDNFRRQIKSLGLSYDWTREVATNDPLYYKWTQWFFLLLYKSGLAYKKKAKVNWCPKDQTVLANEQVVDGRCERCGTEVVQKDLEQWFFRITKYADELIKDLDEVDWPSSTVINQRNWIGKSEGAEIDFPLLIPGKKRKIIIFHGFGGKPENNFIPWLKRELEKMGHTVITPLLPHSVKDPAPPEAEDVAAAFAAAEYDSNTVIVGHSLGAVAALKVAEKLSSPVAGIVLVGGFTDPRFKDHPRAFEKTFSWNFDVPAIRKNGGNIRILHDMNDDAISYEQAERMSGLLGVPIEECIAKEEHFTATEEPELLRAFIPSVRVFTTRADTLFGATYLVLAPEHPLVQETLPLVSNGSEVTDYIEATKRRTELERTAEVKDKTGVELKGIRAVNPATKEEIPVYIADYVLSHYGTGAIMAVPAHDERDYDFAKKFGLPLKRVVEPKFVASPSGESALKDGEEIVKREAVCAVVRNPRDDTYLCISWKGVHMQGLVTGGLEEGEDPVEAARREVREETGYKNLRHIERDPVLIHSLFYHRVKKQNRWARFRYIFFELENEERDEVSEKEAALHEVVWKRKEELPSFFSVIEGEFIAKVLGQADFIHTGPGILQNSGAFDWKDSEESKRGIVEAVGGRMKTTYKLRDWLVSRQRFWGAPIPIIYCEKCGEVPVPENDLPVLLPDDVDFMPEGVSPLAKSKSFHDVKCPSCGGKARRESDTMDTFVCSSWYYFRFADPKNIDEFAGKRAIEKWLPVDLYVGGAEHTVLHLMYSRFFTKVLRDLGYVSFSEPFLKLRHQGLILAEDGRKMSKSLGNVVNPDEIVERLGADTLRISEMFMGPFEQQMAWSTDSTVGVRRFLEKVWRQSGKISDDAIDSDPLQRILHKTIKKVGEDIEGMNFNTAVSQLMICINQFDREKSFSRKGFELFVQILAPFAPHLAEELWESLGHSTSVHGESWPSYEERFLAEAEENIAVSVDGKVRGELRLPAGSPEEMVRREAEGLQAVSKWLQGRDLVRVVFVPGKLINFVTKGK